LGLILIPLNCYWIELSEIKYMTIDVTIVSLFMNVIFCIFVLSLLNLALRRVRPRWAFSQGELLLIYVMLSIATGVAGHDMMGNLLPNLSNAFWYSTSENRWSEFWQHIPSWFSPRDRSVLRGFYEGNSNFWTPANLSAWAIPILAWGSFIFMTLLIGLCICVVVRRQWIERERLTFPIIQLPLEMTRPEAGRTFFSNRFLWLGFSIPAFVETLNCLNYWYPSFPYIQIRLFDLGQFITTPPWNGIGWFPISFYFFALGIAYFLPLDLAFSAWFFYLFRKAQDIFSVAAGFRDPGSPPALSKIPYFPEQTVGAWAALSCVVLWTGRHHLARVWRAALGHPETEEDRKDASLYRWSLIGLAFGLVYLNAFFWLAGASWWVPIVFWAFYLLVVFVITRVRAELGPVAHELNFYRPEAMMVEMSGTGGLGPQNLTLISFTHWFNRGYRNLAMPHQLEAFKLSDQAYMNDRKLTLAMGAAGIVAIFATFAALLTMYYQNGAATANIQATYRTDIANAEAFSRLQNWLNNPQPSDWYAMSFALGGFAFALFLSAMKGAFLWWPFHPIGYGLAVSFAMEYFWFPTMVGWGIKLLITRYGGIKGYRTLMPFFLGLILGDYITASIWSLIAIIFQVNTYRIFI
jgi:hypothetical protein